MAKLTTFNGLKLTKQQVEALKLKFDGKKNIEIAALLFDVRSDENPDVIDEKKVHAKASLIGKWFSNPNMQEAYRLLVREYVSDQYNHSLRRLGAMIDDKNGWLAFNAASTFLNKFTGMVFGEEDKKIVVQVEGMPVIGTPDQE